MRGLKRAGAGLTLQAGGGAIRRVTHISPKNSTPAELYAVDLEGVVMRKP